MSDNRNFLGLRARVKDVLEVKAERDDAVLQDLGEVGDGPNHNAAVILRS